MSKRIVLDATTPEIFLECDKTGGDYSLESNESSAIRINAQKGVIESRNDNGVAQVSASGLFCNNAGTDAMPASSGYTHKGAVVGLGFGTLNKSTWAVNANESVLAGVYGRANNYGTAPAYGGFFYNLFAGGFTLGRRAITGTTNNTTYLAATDSFIIGYGSATHTVYLPSSPKEGQVVHIKQWWSGTMRVRPYSGQVIYDDTSQNDYYDFGEGYGGIFVFTIGYITSGGTTTKKEAWLVNRFKY